MIIFGTSGKMESSRLIFAVVIATAFILSCCDRVSSSFSERVGSPLLNPFEAQCTWLFRDNPDDCRTYFQCLHGRSLLRRCPRKLHWNAEGHYCEYMHKSACKAGASKRKGSASSSISASKHILEVYNSTNEHHPRGTWREPCPANTYKPHPSNCNAYIQCGINNQYTVMYCTPGLLWDTTHTTCNWASAVDCHSSSGNGVQSVDTPSTSTTTEAPFPTQPAPTHPPTHFTTTTLPPMITTTTTSRPTTITTPTTFRPTSESPTQYPILIPSSESQYKIICYFTNWAVYRKNGGQYTPADIDPTKCTHIIYAFACINPITYKMEMCDPWIDGKDGKDFYGQITDLRRFGVKVLLAVGGWIDSGGYKWSLLLKDVIKMETFINSACAFLKKHNFDGLDLDYEYPTCPQANCNFDSKFEKQAFTALIKGLRQMCGPQTLLSAAVSCNENIIKEAYDVPTISKLLDFVNVMTYDFHGSWESKTGMLAPHSLVIPDDPKLNVEHTVMILLQLGLKPSKLCIGMPMYGASYTVEDPLKDYGVGAKSRGPGPAGPITQQKGMLAYYEICNQNWTKTEHDKDNRVGPYRYNMNDGTWVSHDDNKIIMKKCNFIKEKNLGGAMIWSLDLDDYTGKCGEGKYPLLTTINKGLKPSQVPVSAKRRVVSGSSSSNTETSNMRKTSSRNHGARTRQSRRQN